MLSAPFFLARGESPQRSPPLPDGAAEQVLPQLEGTFQCVAVDYGVPDLSELGLIEVRLWGCVTVEPPLALLYFGHPKGSAPHAYDVTHSLPLRICGL